MISLTEIKLSTIVSRMLLVSIYCCLSFAVWNPFSTVIEPAVLRLSKRCKPTEMWARLGSVALTAFTNSYLDSLWRRGPLKVPVWNIRAVKCSTNWGANQANKQTNKTATLFKDIRIFSFSFSLFFLFLQMTHQHKHSRNSQLCWWRYS